MKIQDQCCSLEQAKRLKELGVRGESTFQCTKNGIPQTGPLMYQLWNVAELGVMLPSEVYTRYTGSNPHHNAPWEWVDDAEGESLGVYDTEAQARAALLIHLIERDHTTADEVNARLNS